jgi:hypothetical protein
MMRRVMLLLSVMALGFAGSAPVEVAAQEGRAGCEAYCGVVAVGCYVFAGLFIGKDKCDAMYEGCVDGCVAALEPESSEPREN